MLICSVRGCRLPLAWEGSRYACPMGHSFDIARSGYVNLLQPQDRRSRQPGDTAEAVSARRRLHDAGYTAPLLEGIASALALSPADVLLDGGCGEGFYAGSLAARAGCRACGVDISIPAIEAAARRYPECTWVVANADREIPFASQSATVVISITARMNPPEFRRVLVSGGTLLIALPAPDDLIELRGRGRNRVPRTRRDFAGLFTPAGEHRVTTRAALDAAAVGDVLRSIYRPLRIDAPQAMELTFSMDLLLFR